MVGGLPDLSAYKAYLKAMIAFRPGVERAVADADWPATWRWRPTLVGPDLLADAADLGMEPGSSATVPTPAGTSALLGMLYVLEGSNLGATILRRRAEALGLGDAFGARHLGTMARHGGWRGFLTQLESSPDFSLDEAAGAATPTIGVA